MLLKFQIARKRKSFIMIDWNYAKTKIIFCGYLDGERMYSKRNAF